MSCRRSKYTFMHVCMHVCIKFIAEYIFHGIVQKLKSLVAVVPKYLIGTCVENVA